MPCMCERVYTVYCIQMLCPTEYRGPHGMAQLSPKKLDSTVGVKPGA